MMKRSDKKWWSEASKQDGLRAINCNPNGWSHNRRVYAVRQEVRTGANILDIGCGIGLYPFLFQDYASYIGLDFCKEYIDRCNALNLHNAKFALQDLRHLDLNGQFFDVCVALGVFSVKGLFETQLDLFMFVRDKLLQSCSKVVATVPLRYAFTDHEIIENELEVFELDKMVKACKEIGVSTNIKFGHLPHEAVVVFSKTVEFSNEIDVVHALNSMGRLQ